MRYPIKKSALSALVVVAVALLAAATGTAARGAEVRVGWRFDAPFYVEVQHDATQRTDIAGNKSASATKVRILFRVRPVKADLGGVQLEHTVVAISDQDVKDGVLEKDAGTFAGLVGRSVNVTLGANNRSLKIEGTEPLVPHVFGDEFKDAAPPQRQLMTAMTAMVFEAHLLDVYVQTPVGPVTAGSTWTGRREIAVEPMFAMTSNRTFKLGERGEGRQAHPVTWKGNTEFAVLKDEKNLFPLKVTQIKTVGEQVDVGTVEWDEAAGRPRQVDSRQAWSIKMTMRAGERELVGFAEGTDLMSIRYSDRNPDEK